MTLDPNRNDKPRLSLEQILAWADEHQKRTGHWPTVNDGAVVGSENENWEALDSALRHGSRGLAGGVSLARLLVEQRGAQNRAALAPLTLDQIRYWVLAHHARTGKWPGSQSGPIEDAPGENWSGVYQAMRKGSRGLKPSSLTELVRELKG